MNQFRSPTRKARVFGLFCCPNAKFFRVKPWMFFEKKRYGTGFELTLLRISTLFERIPIPLQAIRWTNATKIIYKLSMPILLVSHKLLWEANKVGIFHFQRKMSRHMNTLQKRKDEGLPHQWQSIYHWTLRSHVYGCWYGSLPPFSDANSSNGILVEMIRKHTKDLV